MTRIVYHWFRGVQLHVIRSKLILYYRNTTLRVRNAYFCIFQFEFLMKWETDVIWVKSAPVLSTSCARLCDTLLIGWLIIPPPNEVGGGVYWNHLVRLSVCPSVCRRHGFQSITQHCFGISISNFMCMLFVSMGRSLLIFSDVTFKMSAWRPYWIFWFPESNFSLALNIMFKLHWHITCVYGKKPIDFQQCHFQNGRLAAILDFSVSGCCSWFGFRSVTQVCFGISISNFICMLFVAMGQSLLIFSDVTFKMAAWWPYWIFQFPDSKFSLALNIKSKLQEHITCVYG